MLSIQLIQGLREFLSQTYDCGPVRGIGTVGAVFVDRNGDQFQHRSEPHFTLGFSGGRAATVWLDADANFVVATMGDIVCAIPAAAPNAELLLSAAIEKYGVNKHYPIS